MAEVSREIVEYVARGAILSAFAFLDDHQNAARLRANINYLQHLLETGECRCDGDVCPTGLCVDETPPPPRTPDDRRRDPGGG